jgi:putative ribosome biogenesis GTPase RsgA
MVLQDSLAHFQDRETAIAAFDALQSDGRRWVLAFDGCSGLGKSTLIDWLIENRCKPNKIPYSLFDFKNWTNYK